MSRVPFQYAVLRVIPRVDRGESINAGVVVYSQQAQFLGARVHLDVDRLRTLDASADVGPIQAALLAVVGTCDGCGTGADQEIGRRFRWLTSPRSTVVQSGPVHTGLTEDASGEPDRLLALLVLPLPRDS